MGSLSIKQRHVIIICAVLLGIVLSGFINAWSNQRLASLEEVRRLYLQLDSNLLTLRRHEKDFLARKDIKYINKFSDSTDNSSQLLSRIQHVENEINFSVDKALSGLLSKYGEAFFDLSTQQQTIGLHSKDGLYGGLRSSIHEVEGLLEQEAALLVELLMLRRHEKDFMLRLDERYLEKFNGTIDRLNNKLSEYEKPAAQTSLQNYLTKFSALVAAEKVKGLKPNEGLRGQMRAAAHDLGERFKQKLENISVVIDAEVKKMNMISTASFIAIGLIMILLVSWISHSISKAIKSLLNSTLSLVTDESQKKEILANTNELTVLGESVSYLHAQLKQAFDQERYLVDAIFSGWICFARQSGKDDLIMTRTDFTYQEPADTTMHRQLLGGEVYFDQPQNRVHVPTLLLDEPQPQANNAIFEALNKEAYAFIQELNSQDSMRDKVRHSLYRLLPKGDGNIEMVSETLNINRRNLQRKLSAESTNFKQLLNELREELAEQYLRDQDLSMMDIAMLLGFSDNSAFTTAFKSWKTISPSEHRKMTEQAR